MLALADTACASRKRDDLTQQTILAAAAAISEPQQGLNEFMQRSPWLPIPPKEYETMSQSDPTTSARLEYLKIDQEIRDGLEPT